MQVIYIYVYWFELKNNNIIAQKKKKKKNVKS